jgi:lipopolysaccharide/colanic/teichoic acid biosynthesis glycosyltransferase
MRFYSQYGKRVLDVTLALGGVLLLALPLLMVAAWIFLVDGPPVLFRQERVGRHGARFRIYKLRTMANHSLARDSMTVAGDPSITRTGRWLRRLKLDELPQLLNVLKGEMSFVGPRPDVPGYMDKLQGQAVRLLELRPGITGPASLVFRDEEKLLATVADPKAFNDEVIFPQKVFLNLQYLEEASLKMDLLYLWWTIVPLPGKLGTPREPAAPVHSEV